MSMQPTARPGTFRLPGFGGAALFLRSCIVLDDLAGPALGVDIGILDRVSFTQFLGREVTAGFSQRLSEFFLAAASDVAPEDTVPEFSDGPSTLNCRVVSSSAGVIELLVTIAQDPESDDPGIAGVEFQTSRSALAQAGLDVRVLESIDDDPAAVLEPPSDWS